jgi:uracil phosphoribosyltransferase
MSRASRAYLCLCVSASSALLLAQRHTSAASPASAPNCPPAVQAPAWALAGPPSAAAQAAQQRTAAALARHPNLHVIPQSRALHGLFTTLRAAATPPALFAPAADRLMRLLAEEGLAHVPGAAPATVATPCGSYEGLQLPPSSELAIVSIVRAGDSLQSAVWRVAPGAALGKVLIQRDESLPGKPPRLFYVKLPPAIEQRRVLLVDPMLATGQSAIMAIGELLARGVPEESIVRAGAPCAPWALAAAPPPPPSYSAPPLTPASSTPHPRAQTFLNVVSCPEGLAALFAAHPRVRVVTAAVDEGLNSAKYIVPGLGDFGDRYNGTSGQH